MNKLDSCLTCIFFLVKKVLFLLHFDGEGVQILKKVPSTNQNTAQSSIEQIQNIRLLAFWILDVVHLGIHNFSSFEKHLNFESLFEIFAQNQRFSGKKFEFEYHIKDNKFLVFI